MLTDPCPLVTPATIAPVGKLEISRTEEGGIGSHRPLFQGRQGYQRLVGGTGRIGPADATVEQRMVAIAAQGLPFLPFHAANESFLIETRTACHGKHRSVIGIQSHNGAHPTFKAGFRDFLELDVDGQPGVLTGDGKHLIEKANPPANGIHLHLPPTSLSMKVFLETRFPLQSFPHLPQENSLDTARF